MVKSLLTWKFPALMAVLAVAAILAACGGADDPTAVPAAPTAMPAAPTAAPAAPVATQAAATAVPKAAPAPTSAPAKAEGVGTLTVAVDGWGSDLLDQWEDTQPSFLRDYYLTRMLTRDENMVIQPLWVTEWSQDANGILMQLHPDAVCQNGEPLDAEAMQINLEGFLGNIEGFAGSFFGASLDKLIDTNGYEIRGDREFFMGTDSPSPAGWSLLHGANYHSLWFMPPDYLQEVGHEEYVQNPVGCGPYELTDFSPGDAATFERWDGFWGDYEYYKAPEHQTLELVKVPEATTRFAQLTAGDVDMALNLPYPIAKDMERSEDGVGRGINPGNGGLWTQLLGANGKMQVAFDLEFALIETKDDGSFKADPDTWGNDPTLNLMVREALELAVDKQAILDTGFGFLLPNQSICSKGSFGWRESQDLLSEYNPEKAQQLLNDAGFGDGFSLAAHFGEFAGRPNQKEAMDIIASNWKDLGIDLKVNEHDPFTYYSSGDSGNREYQSVNEWSWGRQEHCSVLVNLAYSSSGFRNEYNDETDALNEELQNTVDEARQLEIIARVDDLALENHWIIPLYDASAVYGYTDRVLEHKQPPFGAHFMDLNRILLRD